jgi:hypothetical protein
MGRVIVDTSVWSLALRRRAKDLSHTQRGLELLLRDLIIAGDAVLLGVVRQEILTGIVMDNVFDQVSERLRGLDDLPPDFDDYERAAAFANECMRHGVAATSVDMLVCAVAAGRDLPILTADHDFGRYAKHLPIQLFAHP